MEFQFEEFSISGKTGYILPSFLTFGIEGNIKATSNTSHEHGSLTTELRGFSSLGFMS